jgi:hypothetical protein
VLFPLVHCAGTQRAPMHAWLSAHSEKSKHWSAGTHELKRHFCPDAQSVLALQMSSGVSMSLTQASAMLASAAMASAEIAPARGNGFEALRVVGLGI